MSEISAVLLDIDGTLIYSNDQHARAFVLAAEELGMRVPNFQKVRSLIGMGGDKLIPKAFGIDAESEEGRKLDERKGEIFRQRLSAELRPTPGAKELVQRLRAEGMRLVVATSANEDDLQLLLAKAGVSDLIDDCTSSADVEESKPDPDLVQEALRVAGVGAANAIMIGDTPYDVEACKRAGVAILAVRTGGWDGSDLAGALRIYDSPADILHNFSSSPFA